VSDRPMRQPFLVGDRIYLRQLEPVDVQGPYLAWVNDYEVTRFLETGSYPQSEDALAAYVSVTSGPDNIFLAIVEKGTEVHVGNVKLGPIHRVHRRADMGIMIGDKTRWDRGYGREAVALIVAYGFDRLNLIKIGLGVYADHDHAVRLYESLGFRVEGRLRQHLFRDGAYHDKLVMGVLREDFTRTA
jgi:[ribosomal protein S5]-alanine N-acetyltransferase